jgi:hypothetical protein
MADDTRHIERAIETAGDADAFDAALARLLNDANGWRRADMRWRRARRKPHTDRRPRR